MKVLIAGAGIGGLTTALTLHARGFDALVLERANDLQPLGVGINLLPHAVRELTELGLGDALTAMAVAPSAIRFYTHRGGKSPRVVGFREAGPRGRVVEGCGVGHRVVISELPTKVTHRKTRRDDPGPFCPACPARCTQVR